MSRPDWDVYFTNIAREVSTRGTCRVQVGAVVVRDNRVLLTGYNGSPPGQPHCTEVGCQFYGYMTPAELLKWEGIKYQTLNTLPLIRRCQRTIHAEQNIIGIAARSGIELEGATWYLYPFGPCQQCQLLLSTTQPKRVVWTKPEGEQFTALYSAAPVLEVLGVQLDVVEC